MKSLMLLRHAEALPASSAPGDHARALTLHGERQARGLGKWLRTRRWTPQCILCSSALRTRQTSDTVTGAAGWNALPIVLDRLYNASLDDMLSVLREQATDIDRLLLVAHAPGVGELASALITGNADLSLSCEPGTLFEVVLAIDHWSELRLGCGTLHLLLPP